MPKIAMNSRLLELTNGTSSIKASDRLVKAAEEELDKRFTYPVRELAPKE
jgi:hypothetical protein